MNSSQSEVGFGSIFIWLPLHHKKDHYKQLLNLPTLKSYLPTTFFHYCEYYLLSTRIVSRKRGNSLKEVKHRLFPFQGTWICAKKVAHKNLKKREEILTIFKLIKIHFQSQSFYCKNTNLVFLQVC